MGGRGNMRFGFWFTGCLLLAACASEPPLTEANKDEIVCRTVKPKGAPAHEDCQTRAVWALYDRTDRILSDAPGRHAADADAQARGSRKTNP